LAGLILVGPAMLFAQPEPSVIEGFFRERLTPTSSWQCVAQCTVFSGDDTTHVGADSSYLIGFSHEPREFAFTEMPYSLCADDLLLPIALARTDFDSIRVNKTRTRFEGIMCWKARIFVRDETFEVLLSGDGFFRVMQIERKGRGRSNSDDVWLLREIGRGKDLPVKLTRTVEFGWGGEQAAIVSTVELTNLREVSAESDP